MQPYKDNLPIGEPEVVKDDFKARVQELMEKGADEVRVFPGSTKELDKRLKRYGMSRRQRREWIKKHRQEFSP